MRPRLSRRASVLFVLVLLLGACRPFWRRGERPPFRKVTPAVAYEIIRDTPEILILDLRRPEEFQGDTGHLASARNLPLDLLPYRLLQVSGYRDETFLVYCRADDACGQEGMAVLIASGFENAILIDGGIDGWIRAGFKTVLTVIDPRQPPAVQVEPFLPPEPPPQEPPPQEPPPQEPPP